MISLPQPDPAVALFFALQRFGYLALLLPLMLGRVVAGGALARWPALVGLMLCAGGLLTAFAPMLGLMDSAAYRSAARLMAGGGGMAAVLVPTVFLALSALLPDARWPLIDRLHAVLLAAMLGLWWWVH